jgi:polysaccharide export outer membrane protein
MGKTMKRSLGIIALLAMFVVQTGAVQAQEGENYYLRPGDQLHIYVHENPDLTVSTAVLSDGSISYPLVGNLFVEGLTITALEDILAEKLGQYLQRPVVVITVSTETLEKVYVLGRVRLPHEYPYQKGKRLTDYLAMAGGPDDFADLKDCKVFSRDSSQPTRVISLKAIFEDHDRDQDIELQPNDTIYLDRKSGFLVSNWGEIGQILGIILGSTTLFFVIERTGR